MAEIGFAMPLLPGKTDAWKKAVMEMRGARSKDYKASRAALGITREHVSLQKTPHGDMVVVHLEAKNPSTVLPAMLAAKSDFDKWFLKNVLQDTHGLDPKNPPPPVNEVVLDAIH
jgi:hypothetical protein